MEWQDNTEVDNSLLAKYFAGTATPEEAIKIEEWLALDEQNIVTLNEYFKIWHSSAKGFSIPSKQEAFGELQQQLQANTKPIKKIRVIRVGASVAASVILFIGIALLWPAKKRTEPGTLVVLKGSANIKQDTLPDGSIIILRPNAQLSYSAESFKEIRNSHFTGEAYFNIVHDKNHPCEIDIEDIKIKVLGTSFNISTVADTIDVQLNQGSVLMHNDMDSLILKSGQMGRYIKKDKKFYLIDTIDRNSIAYATKKLYFKDANLWDISQYLERVFGYHFEFENKELLHCRMTGQFEDKPLSYILDVIAITLNINYTIKQNTVYINGDGCN